MKKAFCILITILFSTTLFAGAAAFAAGNNAEILFSVGDSILTINGQSVQVETPYVVGAGVTLVPIRVITEAFGAKVDWEGETKKVTVDYPGVNIVLRIGDTKSEVNGRAETLLAAPELTANGYTMVPLRFISENFGADVSYDDLTKKITILKVSDYTVSGARFTANKLGVSFDIPEGFSLDTDNMAKNVFVFDRAREGDDISGITLAVYSKDSAGSAKQTAQEDYEFNKETLNEEITEFAGGLEQKNYGALSVYEYNYKINGAFYSEEDFDTFFEKGDYVYNLSFCFKLPCENTDKIVEIALNGLELSEINSQAAGKFYREKAVDGKTVSTKLNGCSIVIPNSFGEKQSGGSAVYTNYENGVVITVEVKTKDGGYTQDGMRELAAGELKNQDKTGKVLLSEDVINNHKAYKFTVSVDDAKLKERSYKEYCYILNEANGRVYLFKSEYPEISFSSKAKNDVRSVLETIEFN